MPTAKAARDFDSSDWILSYFSLRFASFAERVEAAASAGFAGIGFLLHDYHRLVREGFRDEDFLAILQRHGIVLAEVEVLLGWGNADTRAADSHLETVCHMAEVFGVRHLQVVGPFEGTLDDASKRFARVCDRAAEVGLRVAVEFLPPTNIPDARVALALVERAGRPNGGVCVDAWHHFRGANDEALLRAIPGERIVSLQLSDGATEPLDSEYIRDCLENRCAPGEGEFELARVLSLIEESGCRAPRSFEVISSELQALPAAAAAARIAQGADRLPRGSIE
jgi:sugar phosphate isomerase/epimerase